MAEQKQRTPQEIIESAHKLSIKDRKERDARKLFSSVSQKRWGVKKGQERQGAVVTVIDALENLNFLKIPFTEIPSIGEYAVALYTGNGFKVERDFNNEKAKRRKFDQINNRIEQRKQSAAKKNPSKDVQIVTGVLVTPENLGGQGKGKEPKDPNSLKYYRYHQARALREITKYQKEVAKKKREVERRKPKNNSFSSDKYIEAQKSLAEAEARLKGAEANYADVVAVTQERTPELFYPKQIEAARKAGLKQRGKESVEPELSSKKQGIALEAERRVHTACVVAFREAHSPQTPAKQEEPAVEPEVVATHSVVPEAEPQVEEEVRPESTLEERMANLSDEERAQMEADAALQNSRVVYLATAMHLQAQVAEVNAKIAKLEVAYNERAIDLEGDKEVLQELEKQYESEKVKLVSQLRVPVQMLAVAKEKLIDQSLENEAGAEVLAAISKYNPNANITPEQVAEGFKNSAIGAAHAVLDESIKAATAMAQVQENIAAIEAEKAKKQQDINLLQDKLAQLDVNNKANENAISHAKMRLSELRGELQELDNLLTKQQKSAENIEAAQAQNIKSAGVYLSVAELEHIAGEAERLHAIENQAERSREKNFVKQDLIMRAEIVAALAADIEPELEDETAPAPTEDADVEAEAEVVEAAAPAEGNEAEAVPDDAGGIEEEPVEVAPEAEIEPAASTDEPAPKSDIEEVTGLDVAEAEEPVEAPEAGLRSVERPVSAPAVEVVEVEGMGDEPEPEARGRGDGEAVER